MKETVRALTVRLDSESFRTLRMMAAQNDESMQVLASRMIRQAIEKAEAEKARIK